MFREVRLELKDEHLDPGSAATFYDVEKGPVMTLSDLLEFYGIAPSSRSPLALTVDKSVQR